MGIMEHEIKGTEAEQSIVKEATKPWYRKKKPWGKILLMLSAPMLLANFVLPHEESFSFSLLFLKNINVNKTDLNKLLGQSTTTPFTASSLSEKLSSVTEGLLGIKLLPTFPEVCIENHNKVFLNSVRIPLEKKDPELQMGAMATNLIYDDEKGNNVEVYTPHNKKDCEKIDIKRLVNGYKLRVTYHHVALDDSEPTSKFDTTDSKVKVEHSFWMQLINFILLILGWFLLIQKSIQLFEFVLKKL